MYRGAKCGMQYWTVVLMLPSMLHQFSISSLEHYLVTANVDNLPIPIDQSLFKYILQVHEAKFHNQLSNRLICSIINSLTDLSDLENFATTIEFLFDVGHKFLSLTHSKLYLTPSHCWTQIW